MYATRQAGISPPDADAIRARIDVLDEEPALMRKLLRLVIRIEVRNPSIIQTASGQPTREAIRG